MCSCTIFIGATGHGDTRYLELVFGGRQKLYFRCTKCKRKYDADGAPIEARDGV